MKKFKQAIKFTNYLQEKKKTTGLKIQTNFKYSVNVALKNKKQ